MTGNQLPGLAHVDGLNQFRLSQFFGFDHRPGAQNGYIWDMHNLTGDYAPVLASRPPRWTVRPVAKPNGLYCSGKRFLVDGTALTVDGQEVGQVADSEKQMQGMSGRVVIWPDKLVYTQEGELEHLEASYSASGLVFGDGTYAGQEAEANSITTTAGRSPSGWATRCPSPAAPGRPRTTRPLSSGRSARTARRCGFMRTPLYCPRERTV